MSAIKHVMVLEFNHVADGLALEEIRHIVTQEDNQTISRSHALPKGKAIPVVDLEQTPKTLVIKVSGITSAVITIR